jgi:GTPase SAR1 family protein
MQLSKLRIRSFFRNALGVIVVYDVTERATFQKVKSWLEEVEVNCDKMPVIILVGNKTDLVDQRQVSTQEGRELAKRSKLMFMEASAKTRENVNDVFYELAEKILENPDLFESANRQRQGVNLDQQSDGWMSWLGGTISSWTGCQIL